MIHRQRAYSPLSHSAGRANSHFIQSTAQSPVHLAIQSTQCPLVLHFTFHIHILHITRPHRYLNRMLIFQYWLLLFARGRLSKTQSPPLKAYPSFSQKRKVICQKPIPPDSGHQETTVPRAHPSIPRCLLLPAAPDGAVEARFRHRSMHPRSLTHIQMSTAHHSNDKIYNNFTVLFVVRNSNVMKVDLSPRQSQNMMVSPLQPPHPLPPPPSVQNSVKPARQYFVYVNSAPICLLAYARARTRWGVRSVNCILPGFLGAPPPSHKR